MDSSSAAHTSESIPGPDPGACPRCGQWRKAGMLHDCPGDSADKIDSLAYARSYLEDESPQAAWERIGIEDQWRHDYLPGFNG